MITRSTKLEKAVLGCFRNPSVNCVVTHGKIIQLPATNDSIFMLALKLLLVQMHSFNMRSEFLNIPVHLAGGGGKRRERAQLLIWLLLLCLGFVLVNLAIFTSTAHTHTHTHTYCVHAKSSPDPKGLSHL